MDKQQIMETMNCSIGDNFAIDVGNNASSSNFGTFSNLPDFSSGTTYTCWDYWQDHYYPQVIRESYPVYISERAKDKGKQAFEIIKMLKDSRFLKLETVGDFIDLMDKLIKIL